MHYFSTAAGNRSLGLNSAELSLTVTQSILPIPFIFGVLTTENQQQALDRAGGKHGNKGDEAAVTALKMAAY